MDCPCFFPTTPSPHVLNAASTTTPRIQKPTARRNDDIVRLGFLNATVPGPVVPALCPFSFLDPMEESTRRGRDVAFSPRLDATFHRFSRVDRSRLDSSPMGSYCYLAHDVRLEHFTAAANRRVYRANAPEFRSLGGIAVTTAMRCKARHGIRVIQVIINLESLPELNSAHDFA
jgi:hypothetical protein